ncbi:MAG: aminotransferase class I/II-fold pyridoxal phosphate-dependent enzyme [Oscillospiraceae bacterium]|nr:aminotransferase class I/II-fold pyridoxal phosphate-dependent enzyme [Oscillospiraceae bacterium]
MLYQKENPHGGDIYTQPVRLDFSANVNPFGTAPAVRAAVERSLSDLFRYPDPYCRELRRTAADFNNVAEEWLLFGCGAAELIFSWALALKPRTALLLAPTFSEYRSALESVGCTVREHLLREENDFALTESILERLREERPDVLVLCNPNNPSGKTAERGLLERICRCCAELNTRMLVDECFLDLTDRGEELTLKDMLGEWKHILLLRAFTKSYGMAGLRLGYCLCADAALLQSMSETVQPWNISVPAQYAGVAALGEREFLQRTNELIRAQRGYLYGELTRMGLRVIPSETNFLLFHSDRELKTPLQEKGILIRSCANYSGLGEGWYRIAVKLPEENRELIATMEEILRG